VVAIKDFRLHCALGYAVALHFPDYRGDFVSDVVFYASLFKYWYGGQRSQIREAHQARAAMHAEYAKLKNSHWDMESSSKTRTSFSIRKVAEATTKSGKRHYSVKRSSDIKGYILIIAIKLCAHSILS
jgi:hypothetical protein